MKNAIRISPAPIRRHAMAEPRGTWPVISLVAVTDIPIRQLQSNAMRMTLTRQRAMGIRAWRGAKCQRATMATSTARPEKNASKTPTAPRARFVTGAHAPEVPRGTLAPDDHHPPRLPSRPARRVPRRSVVALAHRDGGAGRAPGRPQRDVHRGHRAAARRSRQSHGEAPGRRGIDAGRAPAVTAKTVYASSSRYAAL